jgi:hypothetical protein
LDQSFPYGRALSPVDWMEAEAFPPKEKFELSNLKQKRKRGVDSVLRYGVYI